MVLIEAMECGLAVVSFDCPWGPRSIIKDEEDGLLVENGRIDLMADALSDVMGDSTKRQMLADNAVRNVKRFQMDNIANQWKQLYEKILSE
jgi:glycosyltransferase involved in cell wall biosynthesis